MSLVLEVLTRLGAQLPMGQVLFLWLGLYQAKAERSWNHTLLATSHVLFIMLDAGRNLDVDGILRRPGGLVSRGTGLRRLVLRLAT